MNSGQTSVIAHSKNITYLLYSFDFCSYCRLIGIIVKHVQNENDPKLSLRFYLNVDLRTRGWIGSCKAFIRNLEIKTEAFVFWVQFSLDTRYGIRRYARMRCNKHSKQTDTLIRKDFNVWCKIFHKSTHGCSHYNCISIIIHYIVVCRSPNKNKQLRW